PPQALAVHRAGGATPAAPQQAVDPVCGMTVVVGPGTPALQHEGALVHFCCDGCLRAFQREHAAAG
ncbi:MAG TPA: hypothetical protein VLB47_15915, partial [Solirubrobacteraceae bacterium]|nr:hypothetical protein [Solirubrobacteraceae bacterium]